MKLRDSSGHLVFPGTMPTGNFVWVDAVNGNDSLATRGQLSVPFQTLTAAKNAANEGDTIMVLPGTYCDLKQPINVSSDATGDPNVAALVQYAEQHKPTATNRPDKPQIERQIADLQERIDRLKQSIGQA